MERHFFVCQIDSNTGSVPREVLRNAVKQGCDFVFFTRTPGKVSARQLTSAAAMCRKLHAGCAAPPAVENCEKMLRRSMRSALLRGEISPALCNKLVRSETLKTALANTASMDQTFLTDALILSQDMPVVSASWEDEALLPLTWTLYPQHRTALGTLLPEAIRREGLLEYDRAVSRLALAALRDASGTNWGNRVNELSHSISELALFRAVAEMMPEKFSMLRLDRKAVPSGPVRKIGVFCASLRTGGAERCAALMMNEFVARNFEVVHFGSKPPTDVDYPTSEKIERVTLPVQFAPRMAALTGALREKSIDCCIFFEHIWDMTFFDVLAAREQNIRTVVMEHNTFSYSFYACMPEFFFPRRAVYHVADALTVLSEIDCAMFRSWGARSCYMPNPLTFEPANCPRHKLTDKTMIFIGRLIPEKGTGMVLEVLQLVRRRHPDARLLLVGSFAGDAYRREIEERIRRENLQDAVEITGFTTDVSQYFLRSSVHLMPSMVEGYPMTLMEAKAHGVPTIFFEMAYLEAARPEYGCIAVGKLDIAGMAEAASALFDDPARLNELGEQAYASLEKFSNPMVYARWEQLFRSLNDPSAGSELFDNVYTPDFLLHAHAVTNTELIYGMSRLPERRYKLPEIEEIVINNIMERNRILFYAQKLNRFVEQRRPQPGKKGSATYRIGAFLITRIAMPLGNGIKKVYRIFVPWHDDGKANWA